MSLTTDAKSFAQEVGLDVVRVTTAEPFPEAAQRIKEYIRRGLRPASWPIDGQDAFCNPRTVLPSARSIIAVAECYLTSEPYDLTKPGEPHGRIARYVWRNYYHDVREKLKKVAGFLKSKATGKTEFQIRCNTSDISEKPIAQRAGIGWFGKNTIICTSEYGSRVVLGEIFTNLELEPDEPLNKLDRREAPSRCIGTCGKCQACIKACPTRAIIKPYVLDMLRCFQAINTREMNLLPEFREIWGTRLYGCTTCQDVCPLNRRVKPKERKPAYGYVGSSLPLIPILQMKEMEYRQRFRQSQLGLNWVNFRAIQRNATVALGNIRGPVAIPVLSETLQHNPSMVVRNHAAWALGKIGGPKAKQVLQKALKKELQAECQAEIRKALMLA